MDVRDIYYETGLYLAKNITLQGNAYSDSKVVFKYNTSKIIITNHSVNVFAAKKSFIFSTSYLLNTEPAFILDKEKSVVVGDYEIIVDPFTTELYLFLKYLQNSLLCEYLLKDSVSKKESQKLKSKLFDLEKRLNDLETVVETFAEIDSAFKNISKF
jgi:hypothetical protein